MERLHPNRALSDAELIGLGYDHVPELATLRRRAAMAGSRVLVLIAETGFRFGVTVRGDVPMWGETLGEAQLVVDRLLARDRSALASIVGYVPKP